MRSLQNLIEVKPLKVEHEGMKGKITLTAKDLNWETITKALEKANEVILEKREVREHMFANVDEARKAFPDLRVYEERVAGQVRVIEVDGYDWTACARRHAKNTGEALIFMVKDFSSKRRGLYEVEFSVGYEALKDLSSKVYELGKASAMLACKPWEVATRVQRTLNSLAEYKRARGVLTAQLVRMGKAEPIGRFLLHHGLLDEADEKRLMDAVAELIRNERAIAVYGTKSRERCTFILARGKDVPLDAAKLLREGLYRFKGSGGGKSEFAMGGVRAEVANETLTQLIESIKSKVC
jgi:alanyl-tRNA synthetase